LSMEDLVTLGNLLSIDFMEPNRQLYVTLGRQVWVPQDLRNKVLNQPVNHWMIGQPQNHEMFTIVKKRNVPTIEWETKIPFFAIICGSIDFLIWIKTKVEHRGCFLENPITHLEFLIPWTPKDTYIVPI
jgi:hypothetical protein